MLLNKPSFSAGTIPSRLSPSQPNLKYSQNVQFGESRTSETPRKRNWFHLSISSLVLLVSSASLLVQIGNAYRGTCNSLPGIVREYFPSGKPLKPVPVELGMTKAERELACQANGFASCRKQNLFYQESNLMFPMHTNAFYQNVLPVDSPTDKGEFKGHLQATSDDYTNEKMAAFNKTGNLDFLSISMPYRQSLKAQINAAIKTLATENAQGKQSQKQAKSTPPPKLTKTEARSQQAAARAALQEAENKLKAHDQLIRQFVENPDVEFYFYDAPSQTVYQMENASRYMIAASIIDLMHNRMDLVQQVIEKDKPLRFVMSSDDIYENEENTLGTVLQNNSDIALKNEFMWFKLVENIAIHEFIHELNGLNSIRDKNGTLQLDGLLPGMTPEEIKTFEAEREEFYRTRPLKGFDALVVKHAFKNNWEYLAVMGTLFSENYQIPQLPKTWEIFRRYFRIDPANNYRDMVSTNYLKTATDNVALG